MEGHIRYEVIKLNWLIYIVQRVSADGDYRDTLHWFFTLNRAEACAKGLAERTWCNEGPIMASFVAYVQLDDGNATWDPDALERIKVNAQMHAARLRESADDSNWPSSVSPDRITEKFPIVTTTEEQHDPLPH
jgi:hypothetical protein